MKTIYLTVFFCIIGIGVKSQKNFIGTLIYESSKKTISSKVSLTEETPDKIVISVDKEHIRIEHFPSSEYAKTNVTTIFNLEDNSIVQLFNDSYGKFAVIFSKEKLDSLKCTNNCQRIKEIRYAGKTKKLLNYKCKEAEIYFANNSNKLNLYYIPEISVPKELNNYFGFGEINGVLFQCSYYLTTTEKFIVTKTLNEIIFSDNQLDPSLFVIPDDYEIMESFDDYLEKTRR